MEEHQKEQKKSVYEDRNYTSEQISSLSRYIGFGLLSINSQGQGTKARQVGVLQATSHFL